MCACVRIPVFKAVTQGNFGLRDFGAVWVFDYAELECINEVRKRYEKYLLGRFQLTILKKNRSSLRPVRRGPV